MLFLIKYNILINDPKQIDYLEVEQKNYLYSMLNRGLVLFQYPTEFESMNISSTHRFAYKVGFLYDCLTILYPDVSKTNKYQIISVYYHFFFTYRRFKDKLDEYNVSRKFYLGNLNKL